MVGQASAGFQTWPRLERPDCRGDQPFGEVGSPGTQVTQWLKDLHHANGFDGVEELVDNAVREPVMCPTRHRGQSLPCLLLLLEIRVSLRVSVEDVEVVQ